MEFQTNNSIEENDSQRKEETSRTIVAIRFLLMVFIVFIHSNGVTSFWDENGTEYFYNIPYVENIVILFFTQVLARCAVPLFFLISGYLFYFKNYSYPILLKKKAKSLLIPFILWPVLYLILYTGRAILLHTDNPYSGLKLKEWIFVFIGKYQWGALPENPLLVFQFWYIRDLILLFIFSPILKRILDKRSLLIVFFAIFIWMQKSNLCQKNAHQGICFFVLGMFFAKSNYYISDLNCISFKDLLIVLLILCPLDLYFMINDNKYSICHEFNVIAISVLMLKIGYWIQTQQSFFCIQRSLADYSFWLFALHQPLVQPLVINVYKRHLIPINVYGGGYVIELLVTTLVTVIICVGLGFVLRRIFPKLFSFMVGGR